MTLPAVINTAVHRHRQDDSLAKLFSALDFLTADADRLAEAGDLYALAAGLDKLRKFRQACGDLERHVENLAADLMPQDIVNFDDEVVLERHQGNDSKNWASESVLDELFQQSRVDASGELRPPEEALAAFREAVRACAPLTGSLQWRKRALRSYGIDPDEYAETTPGRVSVKVDVKEDK